MAKKVEPDKKKKKCNYSLMDLGYQSFILFQNKTKEKIRYSATFFS